jgi:PAS domain S-box-containing protein
MSAVSAVTLAGKSRVTWIAVQTTKVPVVIVRIAATSPVGCRVSAFRGQTPLRQLAKVHGAVASSPGRCVSSERGPVVQSVGKGSWSTSGSDTRLAAIVRGAHDAIVAETLDGVVTVWNHAAERLYGYPAAEMVGRRTDRIYAPEHRAKEAAAVRRIAGGRRLESYLCDRIHRDGTTVTVSVRGAPIVDSTGVVTGVATFSWAVDAIVDTDEASRAGHELRTSLNAIVGFTGTLLMGLPGPLNAEQEHQLRLVQASAETLLSRINQLSRPAAH